MKTISFFVITILLTTCCKQGNSEFEKIITKANSKWVKSSFGNKKATYVIYTKFFPDYTVQNYYISNNYPVISDKGKWSYDKKEKLLIINKKSIYKIVSFTKDSIDIKENDYSFKLYNLNMMQQLH